MEGGVGGKSVGMWRNEFGKEEKSLPDFDTYTTLLPTTRTVSNNFQ